MALGRPSTYTEEMADRICERIAGGESLISICAEPEMPGRVTVFAWLKKYPDFQNKYVQAREDQADALADELLDIADNSTNDWMERRRRDGSVDVLVNDEAIQRTKLRIETRKWIAAKLRPVKYGDVTKLEHSGPEGAPIQLEGTVGLAVAAVQELRALRMTKGNLPAPPRTIEHHDAAPGDDTGEDLL